MELNSFASLMVGHCGYTFKQYREVADRAVIAEALTLLRGNKSRVAARLGIHRNTLDRHIEELKLGDVCRRIKEEARQ